MFKTKPVFLNIFSRPVTKVRFVQERGCLHPQVVQKNQLRSRGCRHPRSYFLTYRDFMRVLAIDHGTKRMGIAISDELGMVAHPLEFIPAEPFEAFVHRLKEIVRGKPVELILVGIPRNMNGSYGPAAAKVQEFVAELQQAVTIPIRTVDERLTSVQAHRLLTEAEVSGRKRKGKVDKSAAAILLQSYLDGRAGQSSTTNEHK
jgi:putative Holliday junction resolvase